MSGLPENAEVRRKQLIKRVSTTAITVRQSKYLVSWLAWVCAKPLPSQPSTLCFDQVVIVDAIKIIYPSNFRPISSTALPLAVPNKTLSAMICLLSSCDTRCGSNAQPTLTLVSQFEASLDIRNAFEVAALTSFLA